MSRRAFDDLVAALSTVSDPDTPSLRTVRLRFTHAWRAAPAVLILDVAARLIADRPYAWVGYELIRHHRAAFASLSDASLSRFATGLDSWSSVDAYGRLLCGPAWAHGLATDALIDSWSRSPDRWLRRLALVSTVELDDALRVLAVCERLAGDRDDMVEKALSWALRALSRGDASAVRAFLAAHDAALGARVKREVGNKLATGLKNPRKT